ncbi:hypothetical protein XA68_12420 [Ophiocordyceps unilateralis]|uniref:Extracellular membrane protein CFEM domain-containing protein n=1 Tax=Ophiocordyceps unilateralis TaxID=268505 RepID=A0A2A9PDM6_OPHUN|nr:hypothetical protein XA68_12420 [Ophiocordyceps unilateralis]
MKYALVLLSSGLALAAPQAATEACAQECYKVSATETSCSEGKSLFEHRDCMCSADGFFKEWVACRICLRDTKKEINKDEFQAYSSVLNTASGNLCIPSPTASFQALFTEASARRNVQPEAGLPSSVAAAMTTAVQAARAAATAAAEAGVRADGVYANAAAKAEAEAEVAGLSGATAKANAEAQAEAAGGYAAAGAVASAEANGVIAATSTYKTWAPGAASSTAAARTSLSSGRANNSTNPSSVPVSGASAGFVAKGLVMAVVGAAGAALAL